MSTLLVSKKNKKNKFLKWLLVFGVAAALVLLGFFVLQRKRENAEWEKIKTRIVKVEKKDVTKVLALTGRILPVSSIAVYSPVSGQIREIFVKEGMKVLPGEKLFSVLQDSSGQRELESRKSEVEKSRLELKAVKEDLDCRVQVKDLFSDAENQKLQLEYERRRLEHESAEQRLSLLEQNLGLNDSRKNQNSDVKMIYVRAPRESIVTLLNRTVGENVFGTDTATEPTGKEVLILSDTAKMIFRTRVLESDLAMVKEGMTAKVKLDAFRDKSYDGSISRISQQGIVDNSAGYTYFLVDIEIANPDKDVRAQMNASVELVVAEKKAVLSLPAAAVAASNGFAVVELVPKKGQSESSYKDIKVGLSTDERVEITENTLKENDEVLEIDFAKLDLKALTSGTLSKAKKDSKDKNDKSHPRN